VTQLLDDYALVDVGGFLAKLYWTEVAKGPESKRKASLKDGDSVRAKIVYVDRESQHVSLSIKQL